MQNTIMVCSLDKGQFGAVINGHEKNIIIQNVICFTLFNVKYILIVFFLVKCDTRHVLLRFGH